MPYQYALDAARLLERCRGELDDVLREATSRDDARFKSSKSPGGFIVSPLFALQEALAETDRLLLDLFLGLLEQEKAACVSSKRIQQLCAFSSTATLSANVDLLISILQIKRKEAVEDGGSQQDTDNKRCFCPERNASDSLLFRLIVALQLCSIRINDALWVVAGRRKKEVKAKPDAAAHQPLVMISVMCSLGLFANSYLRSVPLVRLREGLSIRRILASATLKSAAVDSPVVQNLARLGLAAVCVNIARGVWNNVWMRNQMRKSQKAIVEWNQQWRVVQSTTSSWGDIPNAADLSQANLLQVKQTQKLIEYTLREPSKVRNLQTNDASPDSQPLQTHPYLCL